MFYSSYDQKFSQSVLKSYTTNSLGADSSDSERPCFGESAVYKESIGCSDHVTSTVRTLRHQYRIRSRARCDRHILSRDCVQPQMRRGRTTSVRAISSPRVRQRLPRRDMIAASASAHLPAATCLLTARIFSAVSSASLSNGNF